MRESISANEQRDAILLHFLRLGLSSRDLDELAGHDRRITKGFRSWRIIKALGLTNAEHKGKLFAFNSQEARQMIRELVNTQNPAVLEGKTPAKLKRFDGVFVEARDAEQFRSAFSGVARNLVQNHFTPMKKLFAKCQHPMCSNSATDCAHWGKDRGSIFIDAANASANPTAENRSRFDVLKTMHRFLDGHITKHPRHGFEYHVRFLCKAHHNEYDGHVRSRDEQAVKDLEDRIKWTHPPL